MLLKLPYGEKVIELEVERAEVLKAREVPAVESVREELGRSLDNPISSPDLGRVLKDSRKVLLVVPDNTRAFPARSIIPPLLENMESANPGLEVRILVATGLHEEVAEDELKQILGREVVENYEVINHKASDESRIARIDKRTSFGTPIHVNKLVLESEVVIGAGLIEPHFFAGYSGGRKILLPGVAGEEAILNNHRYRMIDDPRARAGILDGNPIHEDMLEFMTYTRLDFIVNVTIDRERRVTGIFAGDPVKAHLKGVEFLDRYVKIPAGEAADIVVTTNGGYPLDRDIYQAVKGMDTASRVVKDGGVIIIASECRDGLGGHEEFLKLVRGAESPEEILRRIRENEPIYDQWEAQILARILRKAKVILVSDYVSERTARDLLLEHARTLEEALEIAYGIVGRGARIAAIPEGPYVIPVIG